MDKKEYSSFAEIDRDLRILRLQREIDREQLKLNARRIKSNLYPTSLLGGVGGIAQKLLLTVLAKKVVEKFH